MSHNPGSNSNSSHPDRVLQEGYSMDSQAMDSLTTPLPIGVPFDGALSGDGQMLLLSTAFHFTANRDSQPPDMIIISSDGTLFAVHSRRLLSVSTNQFAGLLLHNVGSPVGGPRSLLIPEPSDVFNVMIHSIYRLSSDGYHPSFESVLLAVVGLRKYGLTHLHAYISRGMPLFNTLMRHAVQKPLGVFSFAATEDLEDLAVDSSEYTLTTPLHLIPNDMMKNIKLPYLHRLLDLHTSRRTTFKRLLDTAVPQHATTPYCSAADRKGAVSAYRLMCAELWFNHTSPGTTAASMEAFLSKNIDDIVCPECKAGLREHITSICSQWNLSKVWFTSYHAIGCTPEDWAAFIAYDIVRMPIAPCGPKDTRTAFPIQFGAGISALLHTMSASISPS